MYLFMLGQRLRSIYSFIYVCYVKERGLFTYLCVLSQRVRVVYVFTCVKSKTEGYLLICLC